MGTIITFYSYKGGVGRTMALANIAVLLAKEGKKVLAVDWDLEAPGLDRYFQDRNIKSPDLNGGLIDLLISASKYSGAGKGPDWRQYISSIDLEGEYPLQLLFSGKNDLNYASRVLDFDWKTFFLNSNGGSFIESLRNDWKEHFEVTLIDSRTGITDIGGICTIQLPDVLVLVFTANYQSLEGVKDVAEKAQRARQKLVYDRMPLLIFPLPSRFEGRTEFEQAQKWLRIFAEELEPFYTGWLPSGYPSFKALEKTKIPYVAFFSFGEPLPVISHSTSDPESIGYAYKIAAKLIAADFADAEAILDPTASVLDTGIVISASCGNITVIPRPVNITLSGNNQIHGDIYIGHEPKDAAEAKAIYCRAVAQASEHLPLRGVVVGAFDAISSQKPLCLANVYIDLDTTAKVPLTEDEKKERNRESDLFEDQKTRILPALEAAIANRRMVLLGDPGCGKSTFVNHLAHCLAIQALEPDKDWLNRYLPGWHEKETLPVVIILRDFSRSLPDSLLDQASPKHLWHFIGERLNGQNMAFAADLISQALEDGRAMVLLDGLDEVMGIGQRLFVRDVIAAFVNRYPKSRFLVTSRILSYQPPATSDEPDLRLSSDAFPPIELAPFDQEKINNFINAWYGELSTNGIVPQKDAPGLVSQLQFAVMSRPDLRLLASDPLLLTVMALVHTHKGRLPDARAMLYEEIVDILLWRWEQIKSGGEGKGPRLRQLLAEANRSDTDLKRTLWQLAFEAHSKTSGEEGKGENQNALADIGELRLIKALAGLKSGDDDGYSWARQIIEVMKLRVGLLVERVPEVFTFPHRTFQEYLAGAHLASQSNFASYASALAGQGRGSLWREVILLAVGRLVHVSGDIDKPLTLLAELCPKMVSDDEIGWRKVWLAGDVLLEIGTNRASDTELGRDLLERVRSRMADLLNKGRLSSRERSDVGDSLGRLGDPRLEVGDFKTGDSKTGDSKTGPMVEIPSGSFWMGEQKDNREDRNFDQDAGKYIGESPVHQVELSPYRISKYPVTVSQYRRFMEEGGYEKEEYWQAGGFDDKGKDKKPLEWEEQKQYLSRPVTNVTWYEAAAFACWAGGRLPTEAEWERAARGPGQKYRKYPWGGKKPTAEIVNFSGSEIVHATPVGIFPGGCSPEGVSDLAGNVWEWCWDWYSEGYYQLCHQQGVVKDPRGPEKGGGRVVRGGSFLFDDYDLRCAARSWFDPRYWVSLCGFRVVRVPSF